MQLLDEKIEQKKTLAEKIPVKLEVKANKEFKVEKVKKGLFASEDKKVETGNVVISRDDFKKMREVSAAALQVKADYERLLKTDVVQENKELRAENDHFLNTINELVVEKEGLGVENRQLKKENSLLKARIGVLKAEISELYKSTKSFLKERTEDARAFKSVFKQFLDRFIAKNPESELERVHQRENAQERSRDLGR